MDLKISGAQTVGALLILIVGGLYARAWAQSAGTSELLALRNLDRRVAIVMHRLSTANAELCPQVDSLAGWVLQSQDLYDHDRRAEAVRTFRMLPRVPNVLALVPGGGAADGGVLEDDAIVMVNGVWLNDIGPDLSEAQPSPSYDRLGRQIEAIDAALAAGPTEFLVRRADTIRVLTVIPERGCGYEAQVVLSSDLNGGADGRRISITSGLVAYTESDDELALLLGHELAHNILAHAMRPRTRGLSRLFGRNARSPKLVREAETTADRVGLFLAARAGYDVSRAPAFRRRFSQDYAAARYGFWGYPSGEDRAAAHEETVREIDALLARGAPIIP